MAPAWQENKGAISPHGIPLIWSACMKACNRLPLTLGTATSAQGVVDGRQGVESAWECCCSSDATVSPTFSSLHAHAYCNLANLVERCVHSWRPWRLLQRQEAQHIHLVYGCGPGSRDDVCLITGTGACCWDLNFGPCCSQGFEEGSIVWGWVCLGQDGRQPDTYDQGQESLKRLDNHVSKRGERLVL